jgi:hypothetical protein
VLPALYAHRLGRAYGPDSSLAALHRAIQQLDGLETDCCLTADGELVLLHDPLLELGTTVFGWAHQRSAAEIRAGWLRHSDGSPSDERPLLLDELLDVAPPGATLQLEVKAHANPGSLAQWILMSQIGLALSWWRRRRALAVLFGSKRAARGHVDGLVAVVPADPIARRRVAARDLLKSHQGRGRRSVDSDSTRTRLPTSKEMVMPDRKSRSYFVR